MKLSPHRADCPTLLDPEATCPCARRWLPEFPSVDLAQMRRDLGDAEVAALILAGKLRRSKRFGYVLAPESL